jgi:hypothetical protein
MTKHHQVTHKTHLNVGDFVLAKGKWAEIYHIDDDHGINTSQGWICRTELSENWQPDPEIPAWIVCAANKHKDSGVIFCGARHFDDLMRGQIKAANYPFASYDQGFIDQFGRFYDRKEAWKIAEKNGQIKRISGTRGTLYSEDLY